MTILNMSWVSLFPFDYTKITTPENLIKLHDNNNEDLNFDVVFNYTINEHEGTRYSLPSLRGYTLLVVHLFAIKFSR